MGSADLAPCKKNARRQKAWIVFQDESGITQKPPVRRTWAPKGETPVLIHTLDWKKISVSAALAYRWDGSRSRLCFQLLAGSYDTESLIVFLRNLKRHFRGERIVLIWDGLPAHRSRAMREYLDSQASWLSVELLPGYAPDLNPVELLWGNVKGQELANRCVKDLSEMADGIREGLNRVRRSRDLAFSFLQHVGLPLF